MTKFNPSIAAGLFTVLAFAASCDNDDYVSYDDVLPNAVVTVKPDGDSFYMQLDDSTVLYPSNLTRSPFGDKEVRAFTNYRIEPSGNNSVYVNWLKELLTKQTVETEGSVADDDNKYGNDPVELIDAFPTVCEDGYLTLRFRTLWGRYTSVKHEVNLVRGVDPEDPYTVEFRHNAHGDGKEVLSDGYVAFRLDKLPDTKGQEVDLKVKFTSHDGAKTVTFKYKTRPSDSETE